MICLRTNALELSLMPQTSEPVIRSPASPVFCFGPLSSSISCDGRKLSPHTTGAKAWGEGLMTETTFGARELVMTQMWKVVDGRAFSVHTQIRSLSGNPCMINSVDLLDASADSSSGLSLSESVDSIRIFEQSNYSSRVRRVSPTQEEGKASHGSDLLWLSFDTEARFAFLVGFSSEERWHGRIRTTESLKGISAWSAGFDGGGVPLSPGQRMILEDLLIMAGEDPWQLLEAYADLVGRCHPVEMPRAIPVSWCSWYPYRLGVREEDVLANAKIAETRLKPLGMSIIQVDLGWQRGHLPSAFEENEQFPHGLGWLAKRLRSLGFRLGVWIAPLAISEFDPLIREHPEWVLGGEGGEMLSVGEWFWEPHGKIFGLDLTHPGARGWLSDKTRSLAERGVQYLKADFLSVAGGSSLRVRHDENIVAGGGSEALRLGMEIMREGMKALDRSALLLNCSGPELPGTGSFPLLYACNDTGNTGYVGWDHHRQNYGMNLAGHLFKHRRWGIIQPSCLCVGPPGTIEEARLRATATFMSGGQVDVGDDLTTLPEDRWEVLFSTLPPLGRAAKPLDLFEPSFSYPWGYDAMTKGEGGGEESIELEGSRIWLLRTASDWDEWSLVSFFSYEEARGEDGMPRITSFRVPVERLGLDPSRKYWLYEFWSRQFLGEFSPDLPQARTYMHPGDAKALVLIRERGVLEVSFFGPAVRLLVIRRARPHPWVVGTSFHQSGGVELSKVVWDDKGVLEGDLRRPEGHRGWIVIAGSNHPPELASVGGDEVAIVPGSNGSWLLPVATQEDLTHWQVRWRV